jgi:hypothetical protein
LRADLGGAGVPSNSAKSVRCAPAAALDFDLLVFVVVFVLVVVVVVFGSVNVFVAVVFGVVIVVVPVVFGVVCAPAVAATSSSKDAARGCNFIGKNFLP